MKSLSITIYPNPALKTHAQEVERIDSNLPSLISRMIVTMDQHEGVGLAAPQIGLSKRIIVVKDGGNNFGFINPQIIKANKEQEIDEEGCLSLPGIFLKIKRAKTVELIAKTPKGKLITISASGLGARIFQHEIDHLNGKLIIHRISILKRLHLRKKLKNLLPQKPLDKKI